MTPTLPCPRNYLPYTANYVVLQIARRNSKMRSCGAWKRWSSCRPTGDDAGMPIEPAAIVAKFLRYSSGAVPPDKAAAFAAALMDESPASLWALLH